MSNQRVHVTIPEGVTIDSLGLLRDPVTGHLRFSWQPIERICQESGIDIALLREQDEGNVAGLLILWYDLHLQRGGARNAVLDDLMREAQVEAAIERTAASGGWTP